MREHEQDHGEKLRDIQSDGESLPFSLFDTLSFFLSLFGCTFGISIVPVDILVLLPPPCWGIDGMAEIILRPASVEVEQTTERVQQKKMVAFYEENEGERALLRTSRSLSAETSVHLNSA